jgi:hypothetical protein
MDVVLTVAGLALVGVLGFILVKKLFPKKKAVAPVTSAPVASTTATTTTATPAA